MEGSDMEAKRLTLRKATEEDIDILFELINGLAAYEKRPQDMTGSFSLNWWNGFKAKATPNSNGVAWIGIPHPSNFIKNSEPAKNREGCILSWTPRIVKTNRDDF